MKKTVFTWLLCSLSMLAFAIGNGDGWSRADAIDFDWDGYHPQLTGTLRWYNVDVTRVKAQEDPTLALYITNLSETDSAHVSVEIFLGTSNTSLQENELDLAPGQFKIISKNAQAVKQLNYDAVQIKMRVTSSQKLTSVALSGKTLESSRIDESCKSGQTNLLQIGTSASQHPMNGIAGELKWYTIDLVNYAGQDSMGLYIITTPVAEATISTKLSYDCPCTGSTDYLVTTAAPDTIMLTGTVLGAIQELHAFFSIKANKNYSVRVEEFRWAEIAPAPVVPVTQVTALVWDSAMALGAADQETWFSMSYDSLTQDLIVPQVILAAPAKNAHFTAKLAYKNAEGSMVVLEEYNWDSPSEQLNQLLDVNILMAMSSKFNHGSVYYCVTSSMANSTFKIRLSKVSGSADCANAVAFDMVGGESVSSPLLYERIYKLNMAYFTAADGEGKNHDWKVIIFNRDTENANTIKGAIINCNSSVGSPSYKSKTIDAGGSYERVIRYSELAAFAGELNMSVISTGNYCIRFEKDAEVSSYQDYTCKQKTDYDWSFGHNLLTDTVDAWYWVDLDTIGKTVAQPVLTFQNNGMSNATVRVQYAYECPVSAPLAAEEKYTIAPGRTATKNLNRDQLIALNEAIAEDGTDTKGYYIKISATQPISWQIYLKNDNELASKMCEQALPFNWVSGNVQAADTTLWYKIDLTYAAKDKRTVQVHIDNRGSRQATAQAKLAFACPYESLSDYSATIPAGATRPAVGSKTGRIPYAMYKENEAVWVRLTADQEVRVWAELDSVPQDTIWDCSKDSIGTIIGVVDSTFVINQDTSWFWFDTQQLRNPLIVADTTYVPQVTITNLGTCADTLLAEISFECPIVGEMMNRTVVLQPGQSYTKQLEYDVVQNYITKYKDAYLRIIGHAECGTSHLQAYVTMVDPNKGEDCLHATLVNACDTLVQKAGEQWYKVNIQDYRGPEVKASLFALGSTTQDITLAIYSNCNGASIEEATRRVKPGSKIEREIGELLSGLKMETAYLQLISTDSVALNLCTTGVLPPVEPINICDSTLVKIEPNITYHQEAGDSVWYLVNIAYLDSLIDANALLVIETDSNCPGDLHLSAKQYWDCNSTLAPTTKGLTVRADSVYSRLVMHDMIRAIDEPYAYIQVTGDKCFNFSLDALLRRGQTCETAIEFDWVACNAVPANDTLWYHVSLDTLAQYVDSTGHSTKDLQLTITNLASDSAHMKAVEMKFGCGDKSVFDFSSTMAGDSTKQKIIDYSLLKALGVDSTGMWMRVISDQPVRICVDTIAEQKPEVRRDTIRVRDCKTDDDFPVTYVNPYPNGSFSQMLIHSYDTTFTDTLGFRYNFTFYGDSIRYYDIHYRRFPVLNQPIDTVVLSALTVDPGMPLDSTFFSNVLKQLLDTQYMQNYDTINHESYTVPFDSLTSSTVAPLVDDTYAPNGNGYAQWYLGEWNKTTGKYENFTLVPDTFYTSTFALGKVGLQVRYFLNFCGTEAAPFPAMMVDTLEITFSQDKASKEYPVSDTICLGDTVFFRHADTALNPDTFFIINKDTVVRDTVYYYAPTAFPGVPCLRDSIYVDTIMHYGAKAVDPDTEFTLKAGTALDTTEVVANLIANFATDNNGATLTINELKYYEDSLKAAPRVPADLCHTDVDSVYIVYSGVNDCGVEVKDTFHIAVAKADTLLLTSEFTLCYDSTFTTRSGHVITANQQLTEWTDIVHNAVKPTVADTLYDSVYVYKVHAVVPVSAQVESAFFCANNTYIWEGHEAKFPQGINKAGTYRDTAYTKLGCDSVYYTLNLTVHQPTAAHTLLEETICQSELPYQWRGPSNTIRIFTEAGLHYNADTIANAAYCDSIFDLNLKVIRHDTIAKDTFLCKTRTQVPFIWKPSPDAGAVQVNFSKEYAVVVKSTHGCDSVTFLYNFTWQDPQTGSETLSPICDSELPYTWQGHNKQVSAADLAGLTPARDGSYTWNFVDTLDIYSDARGCDSIVTATLVINPTKKSTRPIQWVCAGETVTIIDKEGAHNYTSDTVATLKYANSKGCDSIVTAEIHFAGTLEFPSTVEVCDTELPYFWRGQTLRAAGTYYDNVPYKSRGLSCDSLLYILDLIVYPTYRVEVTDTICYNSDPAWWGRGAIMSEGDYTVVLPTHNPNTTKSCDSTVIHHVRFYTMPQLPAITHFKKAPIFVCGENHVWYGSEATDTLTQDVKAYLSDSLTAIEEALNIATFQWQVSYDRGVTWTEAGHAGVCKANTSGYLRYEITSECGTTYHSQEYAFTVVPGSSDNILMVKYIPAFAKYNYWLLMIDLKTITAQLGFTPTEDQVLWYKVMGEVDPIGASGWPEGDDIYQSAASGYYYAAKTTPFAGQYYAVISNMSSIAADECATVVRTTVIKCVPEVSQADVQAAMDAAAGAAAGAAGAPAAAPVNDGQAFYAPYISPTVVAPNGTVHVFNLNPDLTTSIEVYNLMGERVEATSVSGEERHDYNVPSAAQGFYLMQIRSDEDKRTLKFMVK